MREREVTFGSGGLSLAGTLATPNSGGPFPAVLFIPGSGQVDRNENHKRMPINAFREMATHLAREGYASLRYDKRGVGASEGDYWPTGLFDNAADALAGLEYLKSQETVRLGAVFLLGHSEGALIATRLAGEGADVAGVILLAGAAKRGEDTLVWQAKQVAGSMKGLNGIIIRLFRINIVKAQRKQLDKVNRSTKDWYRAQLIAKMNARWLREFMAYEPAEDLSRIRVPVLAITGSKDIQVDPADLRKMAELVPGDFEYHEVADVTHLLRAEEGAPTLSTYKKQVKQKMDRRVLALVTDWLNRQADRGAR